MAVLQSVSLAPIQDAKLSAAIKSGFRSSFSTLIGEVSPVQGAGQKDKVTNEAPVSVAVVVPSPPKLLLPLGFTPPSDPMTPVARSNNAPEALNLQQPLPLSKNPVEELAFAAKLVETSPQPKTVSDNAQVPVKLARLTPPALTPAPQTAAGIPQPKDQQLVLPVRPIAPPQTQPDAEREQASQTPEHHYMDLPAVTQLDPAPRISTPVSPRATETTPQIPTIDHVAQPSEHGPAAPLNEITVRISNADQTSASIRMVDHSGELRVAVRASDPLVADTLRGSVDQLTSRLNGSGWNTEVWKPATVAPASRTQSPSQEMFQGQPGSRDPQGDRSYDGQNNNKQKYPDWVEEFYANNE